MRSLHWFGWQIEPVAELDMHQLERVADELAVLYRDRAAGTRVPEAPTGVLRHSGALEHSGLIDSTS